MITIQNNQSIPINEQQLNEDAQKILELLAYHNFDLGILLTDNQTIQTYNRDYRNKDKPTDVLSFPYYPDLKPGERIQAELDDDKNLGDIIISPEYVQKDAPNWDHTFEQRMRVLLVHGVCHLLGYDHIEDADYEVMKKQEKWLLDQLNQ